MVERFSGVHWPASSSAVTLKRVVLVAELFVAPLEQNIIGVTTLVAKFISIAIITILLISI